MLLNFCLNLCHPHSDCAGDFHFDSGGKQTPTGDICISEMSRNQKFLENWDRCCETTQPPQIVLATFSERRGF